LEVYVENHGSFLLFAAIRENYVRVGERDSNTEEVRTLKNSGIKAGRSVIEGGCYK
jgi:hypothetical protein